MKKQILVDMFLVFSFLLLGGCGEIIEEKAEISLTFPERYNRQ